MRRVRVNDAGRGTLGTGPVPHAWLVFMLHDKWLGTAVMSAIIALTGLTGCVVVPDQRHYAGGVVLVAPPAPRVESIGVAPTPGYVWIDGYWNWVGDRHEWVPGHWTMPRYGRHWVAHQWMRRGDGWYLRPGHWERN